MKFYFIYKALAHPETNGYITPFTLAERLLHIKEGERTLGASISWLCDTMANNLKHALGDAPNSEFIMDPQGRVVKKRSWSNPDQVRKDLEQLVGKVPNPTRVSDLRLKRQPPPRVAARGVVERIDKPRSMSPLKIEPQIKSGGEPFYAKLRAEADMSLIRGGEGKLYLRFFMDPLYKVHWNNLVKPIQVTLQPSGGMKLSQMKLNGPRVKAAGDIDPREFLVDVTRGSARESLRLTVNYFACNDEEGWCKPVKQEYVVHLETDRDGGWTQGSRRGFAGRGRPGMRRPFGGRPQPGRGDTEMGRIVKVDVKSRTLTVRTRTGGTRTFKLSSNARIARNRQEAELKDFQAGDMVRMMLEKPKTGPPLVSRMMGRSR